MHGGVSFVQFWRAKENWESAYVVLPMLCYESQDKRSFFQVSIVLDEKI